MKELFAAIMTRFASSVENMVIDVAPAIDWAPGDLITGQTSGKTSLVNKMVSSLSYNVLGRSGAYTLGEVIGVTENAGKLADQGTANPTFNRLTTALGGRMYNTIAPQEATYPYCVFSLVDASPEFSFSERFETYMIQFSIYDDSPSSLTVMECQRLLEATYDDCALSITGRCIVGFKRESKRLMSDPVDGIWHYSTDYEGSDV